MARRTAERSDAAPFGETFPGGPAAPDQRSDRSPAQPAGSPGLKIAFFSRREDSFPPVFLPSVPPYRSLRSPVRQEIFTCVDEGTALVPRTFWCGVKKTAQTQALRNPLAGDT